MLPNLSTLAVSPGNVIVRCSACASLFRKASPTGCKTCGKRKLETSEGPVRDRERAYEQEPNEDESNPPFRSFEVRGDEQDVPFGPFVVTEDEPEMFTSLHSTNADNSFKVQDAADQEVEKALSRVEEALTVAQNPSSSPTTRERDEGKLAAVLAEALQSLDAAKKARVDTRGDPDDDESF